jgi:hypothetical protein
MPELRSSSSSERLPLLNFGSLLMYTGGQTPSAADIDQQLRFPVGRGGRPRGGRVYMTARFHSLRGPINTQEHLTTAVLLSCFSGNSVRIYAVYGLKFRQIGSFNPYVHP